MGEIKLKCGKCQTEMPVFCRWKRHKDNDNMEGYTQPCGSCEYRDLVSCDDFPCNFCSGVVTTP